MKKLIVQLFKFGIVGVICFLIDYGVMLFLTEVCSVHYLISCMISFTLSVIVNYILSMRYVFCAKENIDKRIQFIIFIVLSVIGLGLNQFLMWFLVDIISIIYTLSKLIVTALVMIYNFVTRKLILEKRN